MDLLESGMEFPNGDAHLALQIPRAGTLDGKWSIVH